MIIRLARVAGELGFEVISFDYRGVFDPEERVVMRWRSARLKRALRF